MVESVGWFGVYAPAGTPAAVIGRTADALQRILTAPAVRERIVALGLDPTGTTPKGLADIMARDTAHWKPIVKASGFVE